MSVLDNWGHWKTFLANRMKNAENKGVDHNRIADFATEIGGYLADKVKPRNEQEQVLADLWSVADKEEQHAIANMMVKLVENNASHEDSDAYAGRAGQGANSESEIKAEINQAEQKFDQQS